MVATISSLEVVPKLFNPSSTSELLKIAGKRESVSTFDFGTESKFSLFSLTPKSLQKCIKLFELVTEVVEHHWDDLPDELRNSARKMFLRSNPNISKNTNFFSYLNSWVKLCWLWIRCGRQNVDNLVSAAEKLKDAIAKKVRCENSAEARAIERLAEEKEGKQIEWITVVDKEQKINIEEVRQRLRKRGYTIRTDLPGENSPKS